MSDAISIQNLKVCYNDFAFNVAALDLDSLSIGKGEWVVLTGDNGSGKTTLLKVIGGQLTNRYQGVVELVGKNLKDWHMATLSHHLFSVQQNPLHGTIADFTVWENIMIAMPKYAEKNKIYYKSKLAQIGLDAHLNLMVKYLSGGQRQLLTLLMGCLRAPSLLLLDEPLAALDDEKKEVALKLILSVHQTGTTVVMVSHDKDWIQQYKPICLFQLNKGKVILQQHF